MLKDFIEKNHFIFAQKIDSWQEALKISCKPLIEDGSVDEEYSNELIGNVNKYGAYIVLVPGIAMPHSQEGNEFVHKTAISFMKLKEPVFFDKDDEDSYADLFFTLASSCREEHLQNMSKLSEMLANEELVEKLHGIENLEDLKKLSSEFGI